MQHPRHLERSQTTRPLGGPQFAVRSQMAGFKPKTKGTLAKSAKEMRKGTANGLRITAQSIPIHTYVRELSINQGHDLQSMFLCHSKLDQHVCIAAAEGRPGVAAIADCPSVLLTRLASGVPAQVGTPFF